MFVLGTLGHVDHGKSTLLKALTGMDSDRLAEEKARGMTVDLNFVWAEFERVGTVGFVDVPGHHRYLSNMVAGITGVDAYIFVVAADDGWMPQSEEHFQISVSLGLSGIAVISKTDLVSVERVQKLRSELHQRLGVPVVEWSAGDPQALARLQGAVQELVQRLAPAQSEPGKARLWIDRAFAPQGAGVVVTGTLREGSVSIGDALYLLPGEKRVQVRSLQAYQRELPTAQPVSRLALGLTQVRREDLKRGQLLVAELGTVATRQVDVAVHYFEKIPSRERRVSLLVGTAQTEALLIPLSDRACRLKLKAVLPLRRGDRFLLRLSGKEKTVGAGRVVSPDSAGVSLKRARALFETFELTPQGFARYAVEEQGIFSLAELQAGSQAEIRAALSLLPLRDLGKEVAILRETDRLWREQVQARLQAGPKAQKEVQAWLTKAWGLPREKVAQWLEFQITAQTIRRRGTQLLGAVESEAERKGENEREQRLLTFLRSPPTQEPKSLNMLATNAEARAALESLVKRGAIVRLGDGYFLDAKEFDAHKQKIVTQLRTHGSRSTAELKEILGLSRKLAVLILERLDRDRVTYLKEGTRKLLRSTPD